MGVRQTVFLGAVLLSAGATVQAGEPERRDSGRYGFDASCGEMAGYAVCQVTVRDLVYDTTLARQEISTTPERPGARTGRSISFETLPARAAPQRVTVAVGPAEDAGPGGQVKFLVQIEEGEHVVQRYSLVFPVGKPAEQP